MIGIGMSSKLPLSSTRRVLQTLAAALILKCSKSQTEFTTAVQTLSSPSPGTYGSKCSLIAKHKLLWHLWLEIWSSKFSVPLMLLQRQQTASERQPPAKRRNGGAVKAHVDSHDSSYTRGLEAALLISIFKDGNCGSNWQVWFLSTCLHLYGVQGPYVQRVPQTEFKVLQYAHSRAT